MRRLFLLLQTRMMSQRKLKVTSTTGVSAATAAALEPAAVQVIYSSSLDCLVQVGTFASFVFVCGVEGLWAGMVMMWF
jgi:hypothetical protein